VQPATYGTTSTGKSSLRGCLVAGESQRNSIPCWELYTVDKMQDVAFTGESFTEFALPGYTTNDSAFLSIVAEH